jgi:hypothetical protein
MSKGFICTHQESPTKLPNDDQPSGASDPPEPLPSSQVTGEDDHEVSPSQPREELCLDKLEAWPLFFCQKILEIQFFNVKNYPILSGPNIVYPYHMGSPLSSCL